MEKKIVFVIDGLPGGGAEKVVITLAGGLALLGHSVTIISLTDRCDYEIPPSVCLLLSTDDYHGIFRRLNEIQRRARKLDELVLRHFGDTKIDLVVSNLPKTDRIVARSQTLKNAWMCIHNAVSLSLRQGKNPVQTWLKTRRIRKLYSGRKLIAVSEGVKSGIQAFGIHPAKIECIYNPFDLEKIKKMAQEPCPMEGEAFLLHVGRFNAQKRHDRLFEAVSLSGYQGQLVCLGQGSPEEEASVREACRRYGMQAQTIFSGFNRNPYPYMRCAEALVLSSDYEGFGNVIVESIICGTPVASVACPSGPDEILTGDLSDGLADVSAVSLAAAINRILANRDSIASDYVQHFSLEQCCERYLSLI